MPNAGVSTLATIRTAATQRADMPTSTTTTFVTTAEWNANINSSYQELFDILIQKFGDDYYVALDANGDGFQFTTNGTAEKYALPDGSATYTMPAGTTAPALYKLIGVDLQISGSNDWMTLKPFPMIERNSFGSANIQASRGSRSDIRYRLSGSIAGNAPKQMIWLRPLPMSGQVIQVWYIPRLTALSADGDLVDAVSGWEEFIVIDAAIKALQKEESDCSLLMAQKQAITQRIEAAAENRDAGSPMVVGDARRANGWGEMSDDASEWQ